MNRTFLTESFNEYINTFWMHAFKTNALDPANQRITLLGLAYERGFSSKTVFNACFKKMKGLMPYARCVGRAAMQIACTC